MRAFTSRHTDAFTTHRPEPRAFDFDAVLPGRKAGDGVDATARGHDESPQVRPRVCDGDGRASDGDPGLVLHKAGDFAGSRLGTGRHRAGAADVRDGEDD